MAFSTRLGYGANELILKGDYVTGQLMRDDPPLLYPLSPTSSPSKVLIPLNAQGLNENMKMYPRMGDSFEHQTQRNPAQLLAKKGICIKKGPPSLFQIQTQEVSRDEKNETAKVKLALNVEAKEKEEKVIILLGATGAGTGPCIHNS